MMWGPHVSDFWTGEVGAGREVVEGGASDTWASPLVPRVSYGGESWLCEVGAAMGGGSAQR